MGSFDMPVLVSRSCAGARLIWRHDLQNDLQNGLSNGFQNDLQNGFQNDLQNGLQILRFRQSTAATGLDFDGFCSLFGWAECWNSTPL